MSQLSDVRDDLSRWLLDSVGVQWTAARLDRAIRLALWETEKHVLAVDPEAFKCTYTAATTVPDTGKDNLYSWPVGTFAVHEVGLSSDGENYTVLDRLALKNIREMRSTNIGSEPGFVPYDAKHFILWPSAETAVLAGLRVIVAPTLVMTEDYDENPLPLSFEMLMMKEAQKISLFEVGEDTDDVQKEINSLKTETPRFYLTATEPPVIAPVQDRGY